MAKCQYFIPVEPGFRENCANCQRWKGERCRNEYLLRKQYEESRAFKFFDRLMRDNKGVNGPL